METLSTYFAIQEQEDGTSDRDPDDNPDNKKESEPQA
jgi:hypothetical protein